MAISGNYLPEFIIGVGQVTEISGMTEARLDTGWFQTFLHPVQTKRAFPGVANGGTVGTLSDTMLVIFRGRGTVIMIGLWFKVVVLPIVKGTHLIRAGRQAVTTADTPIVINNDDTVFGPSPRGLYRAHGNARWILALITNSGQKLHPDVGVLANLSLGDRVVDDARRQMVFRDAGYRAGVALDALFQVKYHTVLHLLIAGNLRSPGACNIGTNNRYCD